MCERGVYLRKAIDTYVRQQSLDHLQISSQEWKRVELILDILLPFKKSSDRMEATKRPGIEKVFWIYESLYNELDRLSSLMEASDMTEARWIEDLQPAFEAM